jgi:hypothetical protein
LWQAAAIHQTARRNIVGEIWRQAVVTAAASAPPLSSFIGITSIFYCVFACTLFKKGYYKVQDYLDDKHVWK